MKKNSCYLRPNKFSDPEKDFSEKELLQILGKKDKDLTTHDFMCIFQTILHAGTYEECVYFFPIGIKFFEAKKDIDVLDSLIEWALENEIRLREDKIWQELESCLLEELRASFSDFSLEKTSGGIYPKNYDLISLLAEKSIKNRQIDQIFSPVFKQFVRPPFSYGSACWFFIFLKDFYYVQLKTDLQNDCGFLSMLRSWGDDDELQKSAENLILTNAGCNWELEYWVDVLYRCGR
ncbi:MAG: hypothetical protein K6B46_00115 [Opitutales bacterium]|nr:hypothetical protein [Opitutales bacterium]